MIVRIASASETTSADLAALHARAFNKGWGEADIARLVELPHAIALAAFAPELVGFLIAWTIGEEAEILTLATAPERRRAGVGRALLQAGLAAARAKGAVRVLLEVGTDNEAARALYAKAGFAEIGQRKGYYSGADGGLNALVLKLNLHNGGD